MTSPPPTALARLAPLLVLAAACSIPGGVERRPLAPLEARALALAEAVVADALEAAPEHAVFLHLPRSRYDGLPDDSLAGVAARRERHALWLAELRAMPREALVHPGAVLAHALAWGRLEDMADASVCRKELWSVSPAANGWHLRLAHLAEVQPVGSQLLRQQALARFGAVAAYADAQTENLREGLRRGYLPWHGSVAQVIEQLEELAALPPDQSPFASPGRRDGDPGFRARFDALVEDSIHPALARHRMFLERELLPRARREPGVHANPDGEACYRGLLRLHTTLDLAPEQAHALAYRELVGIEEEMRALSREVLGAVTVADALQRLRDDPAHRFRDAEDVMAQALWAVARAEAALPLVIGRLPRAALLLEPGPPQLERSAAPLYRIAAADGSHPATFRVSLARPREQGRASFEARIFGALLPGRHVQLTLALERDELPSIARHVGHAALSDGWALYAAGLAEELGLYTGPVDRLGMQAEKARHAARAIADTGLHALGWERERALGVLLGHTALSRDEAGREIDRAIAMPGLGAAPLLGYAEIARLRAEAETALGQGFDLRAFHDELLEGGHVRLPLLAERMRSWLAGAGTGMR